MVNKILWEFYKKGKFLIPVVENNESKKMSKYNLWAKWELIPTGAKKSSLTIDEFNGILQITLFCPNGVGNDIIETKANEIVNYFGNEKQPKIELSDGVIITDLIIKSSHKEPSMPDSDGKWFMQPIRIEYSLTNSQ